MRNKKLLWILALVLVVSSVMAEAAIGDTFRNMGNSIGNTFGSIGNSLSGAMRGIGGGVGLIQLIVNTIIIGVFIYIVINITGITFGENKSKTAKFIFVIVIIFLAGALAFKIGNQWIWNENAFIRPLFRFLFSGEDPLGILRPSRILIFIGGSLLLSWLFISTIKIGQGKNKVDIAIAILLAADMTHEGLTTNWLVTLGQVISIWLLYRQFKREGETGWSWSAAVSSAGLVIWISAIAFPEKGFFAVRWMGEWFKTIGLYGSMIFILVLVIVLSAVGLFRSKKEKEAKEESQWKEKGVPYVTAVIKDIMNKIPWLSKHLEQRYVTPEGQFPIMFRKLRIELITLMNYLLRVQVYHSKRRAVEKIMKQAEKAFGDTSQTRAAASIKTNAYDYKVGEKVGQLKQDEPKWDGNNVPDSIWKRFGWYYDTIAEGGERKSRPTAEYGWAKSKYGIHKLMVEFKNLLEQVDVLKGRSRDVDMLAKIERGKKIIDDWFEGIDDAHRRFNGHMKRYGLMQVPHTYGWQIFDQNNVGMGGWFKRYYKFARKDAKPLCIPVVLDGKGNMKIDNTRPVVYYKDPVGVVEDGEYGMDKKLHEVDSRGRFVNDIGHLKHITKGPAGEPPEFISNDLGKINGRLNGLYYRKVMPQDTWNMSSFETICSSMIKDWWLFTKDFQGGESHPNSKVVSGYLQCIENGKFDFEKYYNSYVDKTATPGESNPAFDREAIKDPGTFQFRGKKYYFEEEIKGEPTNHYPCISLFGLNDYIRAMVKRLTAEEELVEKHFKDYVWASKKEGEMFTKRIEEGENK